MDSNEIILSIMIETYNQEDYIRQTLDSIIKQKFSFSYEIIIGNDCSTDDTGAILDEYANKYSQIRVIHNEKNLGAMGNFYNVLSNTKGKYIMDCAGDDFWLPGKVQRQIRYMEKNPDIGLCYGKVYYYYQKLKKISKKSYGGPKVTYEDLFLGNTIPALTVCYRKSLVTQYIDEVHPEKKDWRMEDVPMWLWFAKQSKIKFLSKCVGVYRVLDESESHSENSEKYQRYLQSCKDIRAFYAELYNDNQLLNFYLNIPDFNKAWQTKQWEQIVLLGKQLQEYNFSLKRWVKIFLAKIISK